MPVLDSSLLRRTLLSLALLSTGLTAQAASKSVDLPSLLQREGLFNETKFFSIPTISIDEIAVGSSIDLSITGRLAGSMRCANVVYGPTGCSPTSVALHPIFSWRVWPLDTVSQTLESPKELFGATPYGEFLDTTPIAVTTDRLHMTYQQAIDFGVISKQPSGSMAPLGGWMQFEWSVMTHEKSSSDQFDRYSVALLDPSLHMEFQSAVPEPENYAMLAAGLAVLTVVRRHQKSSR